MGSLFCAFFYAKGPGKISISSPRPPGDPLPQLKRSLREGVRDSCDLIVRCLKSKIILDSVFWRCLNYDDVVVRLPCLACTAVDELLSSKRLRRFATSPATQGHSGWNMVALFAAARNSPCSCPFSVSLHPALRALNSEPHEGSLLKIRAVEKRLPPRGAFDISYKSFKRKSRSYRCSS